MKTQRKLSSLILAGILLIALLTLAAQPMQAIAAPPMSLDWYANTGTGSYSTSGNLSLESAIGQSIVRMPNPNLCAGFLCGRVAWWQILLPAIYH